MYFITIDNLTTTKSLITKRQDEIILHICTVFVDSPMSL